MTNIAIRGAVLRQPADGSRVITFRASTPRIDRHGTRVDPSGLKTDAFDKNPIFVWGHDAYGSMFGGTPDMEHVLGRVVAHRKSSDAFDIDVEFATEEENPKADRAFKLVKKGFLNAVSIGFIPLKWHDEGEEAGKMPLRVYDEAEITEISLVSLPSNQDCIALSRHFFGGTAEQRRYDLDELEAMETILRAGAVLNRANKGKLTQAATLINEVLATAASEEAKDDGRSIADMLRMPGAEDVDLPIDRDIPAIEPATIRAGEDEDEDETEDGPGVYIARNVRPEDARKLAKWAKERGITDLVPAEEMHVTIVASRANFDPDELGDDDEEIEVKVKFAKRLKDAIVLSLDAPQLVKRHKAARGKGATHDFNSYQPHITLSYNGSASDLPEDAPQMTVRLGPEFRREFEAETKSLNSAPPAIAADIGAAASAALRAYLMETAISDGIKRALKAA